MKLNEMYLNRCLKLMVNSGRTIALFATFAVMLSIAGSWLTPSVEHASRQPSSITTQMKTCRVVTNDVGTITGHAKAGVSAFEDAATQCFDRHDELSLESRGHLLDEEAGITVIDQCANIKCS